MEVSELCFGWPMNCLGIFGSSYFLGDFMWDGLHLEGFVYVQAAGGLGCITSPVDILAVSTRDVFKVSCFSCIVMEPIVRILFLACQRPGA